MNGGDFPRKLSFETPPASIQPTEAKPTESTAPSVSGKLLGRRISQDLTPDVEKTTLASSEALSGAADILDSPKSTEIRNSPSVLRRSGLLKRMSGIFKSSSTDLIGSKGSSTPPDSPSLQRAHQLRRSVVARMDSVNIEEEHKRERVGEAVLKRLDSLLKGEKDESGLSHPEVFDQIYRQLEEVLGKEGKWKGFEQMVASIMGNEINHEKGYLDPYVDQKRNPIKIFTNLSPILNLMGNLVNLNIDEARKIAFVHDLIAIARDNTAENCRENLHRLLGKLLNLRVDSFCNTAATLTLENKGNVFKLNDSERSELRTNLQNDHQECQKLLKEAQRQKGEYVNDRKFQFENINKEIILRRNELTKEIKEDLKKDTDLNKSLADKAEADVDKLIAGGEILGDREQAIKERINAKLEVLIANKEHEAAKNDPKIIELEKESAKIKGKFSDSRPKMQKFNEQIMRQRNLLHETETKLKILDIVMAKNLKTEDKLESFILTEVDTKKERGNEAAWEKLKNAAILFKIF